MTGKALNAYAAAGIESDHEAATLEEGRERLRAGLWLLIREASSARNLAGARCRSRSSTGPTGWPSAPTTASPSTSPTTGTSTRSSATRSRSGSPPEDAIVMASLNPAAYHGLHHLGAIAPGRRADILFLDDLESFVPERVLKRGRPVGEIAPVAVPDWVKRTVHVGRIEAARLRGARGAEAGRA